VGLSPARVVSFVMPIVFLTVGSWGLLIGGLFAVSLVRPLAVLPTFERLLLPWSAAVAGILSAFFLWASTRASR